MDENSFYEVLDIGKGNEGFEDFDNTLKKDMIESNDCLSDENKI